MKKALLLLFAGLLLVLISLAPAAAQQFHRFGHANRSKTLKPQHSSRHVKHRDKTKKVKKRKPENGEKRRHKQAKQEKLNREAKAYDAEDQ
jgi:Skp family chaperone for outer membrane proteins